MRRGSFRSSVQGGLVLIALGGIIYLFFAGFMPSADTSVADRHRQSDVASGQTNGPRVVLPKTPEPVNPVALLPTATATNQAPPEVSGVWGMVTASILNVRESPDISAPVVATLAAGECVELVSEGEGWYAVATDSIGGWSSSDFITVVTTCPTAAAVANVVASTQTETVAAENPPPGDVPMVASNTLPSYVGQPFAPNATVARDGWLYECFGQGQNGLRPVAAGTPVQLLGVGEFAPSPEQQALLGSGPFFKIRIWDGQFGWLPTAMMDVDPLVYTSLPGDCAEYDSIDWTTVVRMEPVPLPEWTRVVATPTSASPSWTPNNDPAPARSCCKICTTGKACGDSCISRSYTCHKGSGCACQG